jgi:hypothetical protein
MVKLSTSQKVTLWGVVLAAVLTTVANIVVREWYQPDVRYEEGAYYRYGDFAVTSLKLENVGHTDAEEINIQAGFLKPIIQEPRTSDDAFPFVTVGKPYGMETVTGQIARLVPGQTLYVYFTVANTKGPPPAATQSFVRSVIYKGGKGQNGPPFPWIRTAFTLPLSALAGALISAWMLRRENRARSEGRAAAEKELEEQLKPLKPQLEALVQAAHRIQEANRTDGTGQGPSPDPTTEPGNGKPPQLQAPSEPRP